MLKNPELASSIRDFTLEDGWGDVTDNAPQGYVPGKIDNAVQAAVKSSSHSEEEEKEWLESLEVEGVEDAYLALLLRSMPNLERLELVVPGVCILDEGSQNMYSGKVFRGIPWIDVPQFQALRVVVNNCCDFKYGTSADLMATFLKLPSLREFYGQRIGSSDFDENETLAQLEPASSPLTRLEVRQCKFNAPDLSRMLGAFKNLRTFVYVLGFAHLSYCQYSTPDIRNALRPTEGSLENLCLDYQPGSAYWYGANLSPVSLSSFKVLKNLKVGMYVFFGPRLEESEDEEDLDNTEINAEQGGNLTNLANLANLLPLSIETLYISNTNRRIRILTAALERLLQQKRLATPKLRRVAFEAYITGNDEKFDFSPLKSLAREADVKICLIDAGAVLADSRGRMYTPGEIDAGQGLDGSLTWAAKECERSEAVRAFVDAGR